MVYPKSLSVNDISPLQQYIIIDLAVKTGLNLREGHFAHAHDPHHLGKDRLKVHVIGFQIRKDALDPLSYLLSRKVTSLISHLGGHDYHLRAVRVLLH